MQRNKFQHSTAPADTCTDLASILRLHRAVEGTMIVVASWDRATLWRFGIVNLPSGGVAVVVFATVPSVNCVSLHPTRSDIKFGENEHLRHVRPAILMGEEEGDIRKGAANWLPVAPLKRNVLSEKLAGVVEDPAATRPLSPARPVGLAPDTELTVANNRAWSTPVLRVRGFLLEVVILAASWDSLADARERFVVLLKVVLDGLALAIEAGGLDEVGPDLFVDGDDLVAMFEGLPFGDVEGVVVREFFGSEVRANGNVALGKTVAKGGFRGNVNGVEICISTCSGDDIDVRKEHQGHGRDNEHGLMPHREKIVYAVPVV